MFEVIKTYFSSSTRIGAPATRKPKSDGATVIPKPFFAWLLAFFAAWKLLLLVVAYTSPGPGYDTSTSILFDQYHAQPHSWLSRLIQDLTLRLTRWDAIYFSTSSARGHLYEQEWAFSWFMSRVTAILSNVLPSFLHTSPIVRNALTGIIVSHLSHLGAVISLYALVTRLIPSVQQYKQQTAFTAACLHTISPAGMFLSAPYGESSFAFATFLGILCYVRAQQHLHLPTQQSATLSAAWTILSGLCFALAAPVRSNGLLHGIIFLVDAMTSLRAFLAKRDAASLLRLLSTVLAGSLIAVAFALPQVVAYLEYCTPDTTRPWCSRTIPSIYSWVQEHYWHVGLLAYWTPNNIPLFLLAAPMIAVLFVTALSALLHPSELAASASVSTATNPNPNLTPSPETKLFKHVLAQLAIPQIILATMAITSFHVQIINRISSGCALWYIVLAIILKDQRPHDLPGFLGLLKGRKTQVLVRLMAAYAIVQGGLYAAFLPPA